MTIRRKVIHALAATKTVAPRYPCSDDDQGLVPGAGGSSLLLAPRWLRRRQLPLKDLCAVEPTLRHPVPGRLARRVARELGHLLALGGVSAELFRWIHRPLLLADRQAIRRHVSPARNWSAKSDNRNQHRASSRHLVLSSMSDDRSANCRHSLARC
jgi:hypothetical protein